MSRLGVARAAHHQVAAALFLAANVAGCADDFDPGSLLTSLRVVGARTEVVGAPERATPLPGETATITLRVAGPEPGATFTWAAFACGSPGAPAGGVGPCVTGTLAEELDDTPGTDPPMLTVSLPAALEPSTGATEIVAIGVLCPEGAPDPSLLRDPSALPADLCVGPAGPGQAFLIRAPIAYGPEEQNRNPSFPADEVSLGGAPWPAMDAPPPPVDCAELGMLTRSVQDQRETEIGIGGFPPEDRETFTRLVDQPPRLVSEREALTISLFTTAGELDRQFSVIDDATRDDVAVLWQPPPPEEASIPPGGRTVRFVLAVRDGRGGFDAVDRWLCLLR